MTLRTCVRQSPVHDVALRFSVCSRRVHPATWAGCSSSSSTELFVSLHSPMTHTDLCVWARRTGGPECETHSEGQTGLCSSNYRAGVWVELAPQNAEGFAPHEARLVGFTSRSRLIGSWSAPGTKRVGWHGHAAGLPGPDCAAEFLLHSTPRGGNVFEQEPTLCIGLVISIRCIRSSQAIIISFIATRLGSAPKWFWPLACRTCFLEHIIFSKKLPHEMSVKLTDDIIYEINFCVPASEISLQNKSASMWVSIIMS